MANVAYNKNNKVVSFGTSFVNASTSNTHPFLRLITSLIASIAPSQPTVSWQSVLSNIEELLGGQFNNHPPSLEYLVRPDMSVALTHVLQIQNTTDGTWYEAYICAHTGQLLSVNDFVAHASVSTVEFHYSLAYRKCTVHRPADSEAIGSRRLRNTNRS